MNKETPGYTVCMYGKSGGCSALWVESLDEAFNEIKSMEPHEGITIVKLPFKKRMSRFVIEKPKGLRDSGIFTKPLTKMKVCIKHHRQLNDKYCADCGRDLVEGEY
jgi:hypothetical protein